MWRDVRIDTAQTTLTQNLTPLMNLQASLWGQVLNGFQSNPYRRVRVGPPARKATPRGVNVEPRADYHVGVVLTFDGFGGLAKWEKHPKHAELKKKYDKLIEKVVTHDFEP